MSAEAKRRWYHKNKDRINAERRGGGTSREPRKCELCGRTFTPKRANQILCGRAKCKRRRQTQLQLARKLANPDETKAATAAAWAAMTPEQRAGRNAYQRDRYRTNPEPKRTKNREAARQRREDARQ